MKKKSKWISVQDRSDEWWDGWDKALRMLETNAIGRSGTVDVSVLRRQIAKLKDYRVNVKRHVTTTRFKFRKNPVGK